MNWNRVETDVTKGPLGLFKWVFIGIFSLCIISGSMYAIFKPGKVAVDRVVFKNSFQYKEGMAQRGAVLEANLAEIDMQIARNPDKRTQLEAQKKVIQAQIRAITINN